MRNKGSITIYMCLIMTIVISLIVTGIRSVGVADARLLMVSSVDLGLYSVFGQYDKTCLKETNLLFVDGGYGKGTLQMNRIYQTLKQDIADNFLAGQGTVMQKNFGNGALEKGSITGYTLATDAKGKVFQTQVIDYMESTLGAQGVRLLLNQFSDEDKTVEEQQEYVEGDSGDAIEEYEQLKDEGEGDVASDEGQEIVDNESTPVTGKEPPKDFVNPIEVIKKVREMGLLTLVVPKEHMVSEKTLDLSQTVSMRPLSQGMGVIAYDGDVDTIKGNLLFQEYIVQNLGNYTKMDSNTSLSYAIEYILQGKDSDMENLKGVVNQLFLMREAANAAHLMKDPVKKNELSAMALVIGTAIGLPGAAPAIEKILLLCWAFGESVLDIRELLSGGTIALIKDQGSWQLSLERLPYLTEGLDSLRKSSEKGLSYVDYLRVLLFLRKDEDKVMRTMDVVEMSIQNKKEESFYLDSCIASLEVEVSMRAWDQTFIIQRNYGYGM